MVRLRFETVAALIIVLASGASAAQLRPRDEARSDPSFFEFRQRLIAAVRKRDRSYVLTILDPKIRVNFGEGGGAAEFARQWKLSSTASPLWKTLGEVLSMGGTFSGTGSNRQFAAPYTYSAFPDTLDAFEHFCVIAPNVPLRAKPDDHSRVIARLDYDIVRLAAPPRDAKALAGPWLQVATAKGKHGYVARRFLRSPIDYRALFQKRNGAWRMTALVAGD